VGTPTSDEYDNQPARGLVPRRTSRSNRSRDSRRLDQPQPQPRHAAPVESPQPWSEAGQRDGSRVWPTRLPRVGTGPPYPPYATGRARRGPPPLRPANPTAHSPPARCPRYPARRWIRSRSPTRYRGASRCWVGRAPPATAIGVLGLPAGRPGGRPSHRGYTARDDPADGAILAQPEQEQMIADEGWYPDHHRGRRRFWSPSSRGLLLRRYQGHPAGCRAGASAAVAAGNRWRGGFGHHTSGWPTPSTSSRTPSPDTAFLGTRRTWRVQRVGLWQRVGCRTPAATCWARPIAAVLTYVVLGRLLRRNPNLRPGQARHRPHKPATIRPPGPAIDPAGQPAGTGWPSAAANRRPSAAAVDGPISSDW